MSSVTELNMFSIGFIALCVASLFGESLADVQLENFKADKQSGKTKEVLCKRGLWSVSRHPNYRNFDKKKPKC